MSKVRTVSMLVASLLLWPLMSSGQSLADLYTLVHARSLELSSHEELKALSARAYVSNTVLAVSSMAVGDMDAAVDLSLQACDEREPIIVLYGRMFPDFQRLRDDPRFAEVLRRLDYPTQLMVSNKACPVLFQDSTLSKILVFRHPFAGVQLVKGTIEPGEAPADAALRELREESGIGDARVEKDLGLWDSGFGDQVWSFHLCSTPRPLPDTWVHRTKDGGGLDFEFFWHPVDQKPDATWQPLFQRALEHILECVQRFP